MNATLEPADYTVTELHEAIDDLDDPEALSAMLSAEANGKDRKTAKEAIEERLDTLQDGPAKSEPDDDAAGPKDDEGTTDQAPAAPDDPADPDVTALGLAVPDESELPDDEPVPEPDLNQQLLSNLMRVRTVLEDATGRGGSVDARLDQLQAEVSDLKAYTEALETFLDEEGTGQHIVKSVRQDLAALTDEVEHLELVLARHERDLNGHGDRLDDLDDDLESHRETVTDRFDTVEGTLDDHAGVHDDITDRLETLSEEVAAVGRDIDDLESALADGLESEAEDRAALERRVDTLGETSEDLSTRIDDLADEVADLDSTVDQRVAALEDDLDEIQAWREQLGSAMLGNGGDDA